MWERACLLRTSGTCQWHEQARVSRLLLARSLKAGPLYFLRELPALMARHPFVTVCIGIVLAVVLWLIRWRRAVGAVTTR